MDKDEVINARRRFEQELRLFYNARCKKPEWTRQRISEVINDIEEYEAAPRLNVKRNPNHHFYVQMWPSCKIINGRPRHPASQGSVERANQDVENMLQAWLQDNNSTNWSIGIRFVQYQKNCSFHRTIKRTPYKALFGVDPQIGLLSQVPADLLSKLRTEEDLEKILNQQQSCSSATPAQNDELPVDYVNLQQPSSSSAAPAPIETCDRDLPVESVNLQQSASGVPAEQILLLCVVCGKECTGAHSCYSCARNVHVICGITSCDEGYGSQLLCFLCNSEKNIQDERDQAAEKLRKAAQKMKTHSSQKFPDIDVGSSVLIEIPKIDREPLDQKNVLVKVLEKRNESHKIGTSVGILKDWLPRNAIQLSNITLNDPIPNENLSLREICQKLSRFGGQGYLKCSCKKSNIQCSTNRCACKKHSVLCNSRCHDSSPCLNKN